jgi:hypothetical protein
MEFAHWQGSERNGGWDESEDAALCYCDYLEETICKNGSMYLTPPRHGELLERRAKRLYDTQSVTMMDVLGAIDESPLVLWFCIFLQGMITIINVLLHLTRAQK